MKENQKKVFEKIFEMDFKKEPVKLLEELEEDINKENEIQLEETVIEETKEIILDYKMENRLDRSLILSIAAGLPTEEFLKAEYIYRQMEDREGQEERKTVYKYYLEGSLLAGSLAQYAAIMSEGFVEQYQTITYNAIGLENFLEFHGNEFLGLKAGLLYYLDDLCNNNKRSMMKTILYRLEDEGIIKYGNISDEYRTHDGEILQGDYIKEVLIDVFRESLEIDLEGAKELVNTHFKSEIVERKMRFIDRYRLYQKKYEEKNDRIINYVFSENLPAQLFRQIGSTYIIDSNLVKQDDELRNNFINRIEVINEEKLENFKEHSIDIFEPFVLLKENGNGVNARNRLKERAKINEITDMLSQDYLKAAIKDIVIELDKKDRSLLVDIFKKCQSSKEDEFVNLIIDRLLYSRYLKGLINESELKYSSRFLKDNPDFFANCNKTYPLDRVIIEQLKKMPAAEIRELWDWKVSADGIFLILGSETEEDNIFEYHSETNPLDNKLEEIKLELNEPSNNRIYGSEKMPSNYRAEYDKNYHYREEDAYNFTSNQGVGVMITSGYKDPAKKIRIDGKDISGEYEEKDRESVDIGERTVTLRDRYFGENIILKNMKKTMGKIAGDLLYIYGPGKKNQLLIEGFVSGDYGIELKEKAKEVSDEKEPIRFTDYKIEIDPFEMIILEEFEVFKSLNEHSRVRLRGIIREEKAAEYRRYCKGKDPSLVIKYLFNDQEKYLFKGIIYYSDIHNSRQNASIEIEAVSYSVLLEREMRYRIYQNQGSSYQDIFNILKRANPDFNFTDDGTVKDKPIITEDYPVVLQYRETDWDFILRIASYLDKAVFVNDIRDRTEKIDILVGCHPAPAVEMKNISGEAVKETGPKNIKYNYLKVMRFVHKYEEDLFEVGKKVRHRFKLWGKGEMESIILKNRIYLEKGILYSDYILAREEDINILNRERKIPIEGRSFRAEVVEVNREHRAKVRFLDLEDDFEEGKARYFPIDRYYRESYFAPEKGDIVDIYFKSKNERYAALKGSSTEGREDIKNPPEEKVLARTPGGYTIVMSNDSIEVRGRDGKNVARVKGDRITYRLKKDGADSEITIDSKMIRLRNKNSEMVIDDTKTELNSNGTKVRLSDKGIEFM